jgi:hypothetical protein
MKKLSRLGKTQRRVAGLEQNGGNNDRNVFKQLSVLYQEHSVEEYIQEYERLIAQVARLLDVQYVGYFLNGLKDGI